jgi:hypothetical protein
MRSLQPQKRYAQLKKGKPQFPKFVSCIPRFLALAPLLFKVMA